MKRKEFLKLAGAGTGSVLFSSGLVSIFSTALGSCNKDSMMGGMNGMATNGGITEGDFLQALPIP